MTESEMLALCDAYMEACGFRALKYSVDRRTRSQLAGHPDRLYIGHGRALFVEGKLRANTLTVAEEDWWDAMRPHLGGAVDGRVWRSLEDAVEWVEMTR